MTLFTPFCLFAPFSTGSALKMNYFRSSRRVKAHGSAWRCIKARDGAWRRVKAHEGAWRRMEPREGAWRRVMAHEGAWWRMRHDRLFSLNGFEQSEIISFFHTSSHEHDAGYIYMLLYLFLYLMFFPFLLLFSFSFHLLCVRRHFVPDTRGALGRVCIFPLSWQAVTLTDRNLFITWHLVA